MALGVASALVAIALAMPIAILAVRHRGRLSAMLERSIYLSLARPGLGAAGVLVFAFVLGDLASAQVLLPPSMYTLGTQFWANSRTVAYGAAAPYGAVLVVLALVATYVLMGRFGKVRGSRLRPRKGR